MSNLIEKAILFATEHHRGQLRKQKGEVPYCLHCHEVTKHIATRYRITAPNILAAAETHDIIEDTLQDLTAQERYQLLVLEFNQQVADFVWECSRFPEGDVSKQIKLDFLRSFQNKSIQSIVIKIADRYCNVYDFYYSKKPRYAAWYALQALPLYEAFFSKKQHALSEKILTSENVERIEEDIATLLQLVTIKLFTEGHPSAVELSDQEFEKIVLGRTPKD